jgi:hypothetical protein
MSVLQWRKERKAERMMGENEGANEDQEDNFS